MDITPLLFPDGRLPQLHAWLLAAYGKPAERVCWDPLRQLVYSILSPRTRTEVSDAALDALEARFDARGGDWRGVRDAPLAEVESVLAAVTFSEKKAFHLQQALRRITRQNGGQLALDFFAGQPVGRIRGWLETFDGVGAKASASVVNFSTLRLRALAVDAHHHRIAIRLGLVPRGASAPETERRLLGMAPADWTAEVLDEHHSLVKLHGQRCCTKLDFERNCGACPLLAMCPTGSGLLGEPAIADPRGRQAVGGPRMLDRSSGG